jgi:hypothetical protein
MSREQLKVWGNFIAYEVVWFATPQWRALLCLALGWSLAIGLLAYLAGRWAQTLGLTPAVTRELVP